MAMGLNTTTLNAILAESIRAEEKHGRKNTLLNERLPEILKLSALMEEVGEVAQLYTYDKRPDSGFCNGTAPNCGKCQAIREWRTEVTKELIQVANLAAAWAESLDHGGT
jgi:hypothetical protein